MIKKVIAIVAVAIFIISILPLSSTAQESDYRRSVVYFVYRGKIYHFKSTTFLNGGSNFLITGNGTAQGYHEVESLLSTKSDKINTHIRMHLAGSTALGNSSELMRMEKEALQYIEDNKKLAIEELNNLFFTSDPQMSGEEFAKFMNEIKAYYDELEINVKNSYSVIKENMRIVVSVNANYTATANTGIEMNPGNSGYINQEVLASSSSKGDYTKITSEVSNTDGTTKKQLDVSGFISDQMKVEGYAYIWESTETISGDGKSGWWDVMMP